MSLRSVILSVCFSTLNGSAATALPVSQGQRGVRFYFLENKSVARAKMNLGGPAAGQYLRLYNLTAVTCGGRDTRSGRTQAPVVRATWSEAFRAVSCLLGHWPPRVACLGSRLGTACAGTACPALAAVTRGLQTCPWRHDGRGPLSSDLGELCTRGDLCARAGVGAVPRQPSHGDGRQLCVTVPC